MENVIKYVKAINGILFGGYVRDKMADISQFHDVDCRINKEQLTQLINILLVDNIVIENIVGENYKRMEVISYTVTPKANTNQSFKFDVLCCTETKWFQYPCDFDVNMLAESNDAMYIRPHFLSSICTLPDKISHILSRCKSKKFALVALPRDNFTDISVLLFRSKNLVQRGWTMDDFYFSNASWIFSKWSILREEPRSIRLRHNDVSIEAIKSQTTCSLCLEPFSNDDIVFNTCCNHNFHWECHTENSTGICHWFYLKKCFSCPVCKQEAVKHVYIYNNLPRIAV